MYDGVLNATCIMGNRKGAVYKTDHFGNEKREDKRVDDNPKPGSRNLAPESNIVQTHAKVHGRKWKVNQPKI